jgi:hypothetical protein
VSCLQAYTDMGDAQSHQQEPAVRAGSERAVEGDAKPIVLYLERPPRPGRRPVGENGLGGRG